MATLLLAKEASDGTDYKTVGESCCKGGARVLLIKEVLDEVSKLLDCWEATVVVR